MSANSSQDPAAPDPSADKEDSQELQRGGTGAASALERMKADHAMRHKHKHGVRASGPGHDEDQTPDR